MSAAKSHLFHRLQLAAHNLQKSADRALIASAGVSTAQAAVLSILATGRTVMQRDVAMQLGLNESGITAMVRRMVASGLIERVRDEDDVRAWQLRLSNKGRAALARSQEAFKDVNRTIEATLGPDEIGDLAEYLARLAVAFQHR
jgi:MarR family transcriptional regulator, organic hydroperoxide resistance regulator